MAKSKKSAAAPRVTQETLYKALLAIGELCQFSTKFPKTLTTVRGALPLAEERATAALSKLAGSGDIELRRNGSYVDVRLTKAGVSRAKALRKLAGL